MIEYIIDHLLLFERIWMNTKFFSHNRTALSLTILIAVSLFLRLAALSYPSQVVFDEVGFGKFINAYGWTHERFFDIHPPHSKLLIAAVAKIGGYHGGIDFSKIGNVCTESIAPIRFLPALAGALIPVMIYFLLLQLGASIPAAFMGAWLITFDNAFVVQSRVIGLDTLLIFFMLASFSAVLAARKSNGLIRTGYIVLCGALSGMAVGTKMTGLTVVALTTMILFENAWNEKSLRSVLWGGVQGCLLLASAFGIFLLGWLIHFHLLYKAGSGDAFFIPSGHLISDMFHLNKIMIAANAGITATHPYSSYWWQWLIMKKPIFYWSSTDSGIYLIGNPVVWWGTTSIFFWLMGYLIFARARNLSAEHAADNHPLIRLPIAAYLISILPLVPIVRPLFLYHYMPSLTFSLLAAILWLDLLDIIHNPSIFRQRIVYGGILGCSVIMFILLSPITYGVKWLATYQRILGLTGFGP